MNRIVICLICFISISALGFYWSDSSNKQVVKEQHALVSDIVNIQVSSIERRLSRALSTTEILAIELKHNQGEIDNFEAFAQSVIDSIGGVSNLQLAPAGIIAKIHPLEGNEKAIGHNILQDDRRKEEAWLAIERKELTLAGPFDLVQGGIAIIGRNPVFLGVEGQERFWGFTSALIYLDDLLAVTDLSHLESKGYSYQLTRIYSDTQQAELIAQSKTPIDAVIHSAQIQVPNGLWRLEISHRMHVPFLGLLGYAVSLLIATLATWIAWNMLHYPQQLQRVVEQKTLELESLAFNDHLTELANRRSLTERMKQLLGEGKRYKKHAALMYLDLDDFKRINDSMGHDAGDMLLQQIASRLREAVRESDFVARLGGDEFAVLLLNEISIKNVSKVADKLIEVIGQPVCIEDRCFSVSSSIGITMIPSDGNEVSTLLRNADLAMYAAKHAGKCGYHFFDQQMQDEAIDKHQLEMDLAEAVTQNQLELHYQPLMDLQTGLVSGHEALLRWHHPTRGFMPPDQFIGLAEESGKIVDLGYWVIREVCELISQRMLSGHQCDAIAVNLSPKQFIDPDLLANIRSIVKDAGIDARLLEVEITESTLMGNVEDAIKVMKQLREMGIRIAIDDFGTGYSSLAVLRRFPVDKLKIDRSFVARLIDGRCDQKIVRAIIAMAHTLQIDVVAEGIEEQQQFEILKNAKCDVGQGYLFARPEPAEKVFKLANLCADRNEVA